MACVSPFVFNSNTLPCGKCVECKKRIVSVWSFRLLQEAKDYVDSFFITLTYDTRHVPISPRGYMTLCKRDHQLFMKRLRKKALQPIRFFVAGEYGSANDRPHFHYLLFNVINLDDVFLAWKKGHIHVGYVSGASVGYCLKYIMKPGRIPLHKNDDRVPEFRCMSQGIGRRYLTDAMVAYHRAAIADHYHATLDDGRRIPLPRYYAEKIYTSAEREQAQASLVPLAVEKSQQLLTEMYERNGHSKTPAQLRRELAENQKSLLDAEAKKRKL